MSGPLLDRIDLTVEVQSVSADELTARGRDGDDSERVRRRVVAARAVQARRQTQSNARLAIADLDRHCAIDVAGERLVAQALARSLLSARAYHRVLRVARTIADLDAAEAIDGTHLAEAIGYRRSLDRLAGYAPTLAA